MRTSTTRQSGWHKWLRIIALFLVADIFFLGVDQEQSLLAKPEVHPVPSLQEQALPTQENPTQEKREQVKEEKEDPTELYYTDAQGNMIRLPIGELLRLHARKGSGDTTALPPIRPEELQNLLQTLQDQHQPSDEFTLTKVELIATVVPDKGGSGNSDATLDLRAHFEIALNRTGWVKVPLGLQQGFLQDYQYKGDGTVRLHQRNNVDGHHCELLGNEKSDHQLDLHFVVPLTRLGNETFLPLALPKASVSSIELTIPQTDLDVHFSKNDFLTNVQPDEQTTVVRAFGAHGDDFQISWRPQALQASRQKDLLQVVGQIHCHLEGYNRIYTQANLQVRNLTGTLKSFTIRLPAHMQLIPTLNSNYKMEVIPSESLLESRIGEKREANFTKTGQSKDHQSRSSSTMSQFKNPRITQALRDEGDRQSDPYSSGDLVKIELLKPTTDPFEIQLAAEMILPYESQEHYDFQGFEVLEAEQQWGELTLEASRDWEIEADYSKNFSYQAVDDAKPGHTLHKYNYNYRPGLLSWRIHSRETSITVEPTYSLLMDEHSMRMKMYLKYKTRGAKAKNLAIDMAGWRIENIDSPGISYQPFSRRRGNYWLSLPEDQPDEFTLVITATRSLPANNDEKEILLPVPRGDSISSGQLFVLPADNLTLFANEEKHIGLESAFLRSEIDLKLPRRQKRPLTYLMELSQDNPQFVFRSQIEKQVIDLETTCYATYTQEEIQVRTLSFDYRIHYVPLREIRLHLPPELTLDQLDFSLDRSTISQQQIKTLKTDENGTNISIEIPQEKIGRALLRVQYKSPITYLSPKDIRADYQLAELPLVTPEIDETYNTVSFRVRADRSEGVTLSLPSTTEEATAQEIPPLGTSWQLQSTPVRSRFSWFITEDPLPVLSLHVQTQSEDYRPIVIEKGWFQSSFHENDFSDRFTYRIRAHRSPLILNFPQEMAEAKGLQIMISSGEKTKTDFQRTGSNLKLDISEFLEEPFLLQIVVPRERATLKKWWGLQEKLEAPIVVSAKFLGKIYWEVVLPEEQHLLIPPQTMTDENHWQWYYLFFRRQTPITADQIHHWVTDSPKDILASGTQNRYLYSANATPLAMKLFSVNRLSLVGLGAIIATILLYLLNRYSASKVPILLAVYALSLLWTEITILSAQAAMLFIFYYLVYHGIVQLFATGKLSFRKDLPTSGEYERTAASSKSL
ncbi:MAG: hypothetical protein MPJ24_07115 [Pirellulaceae bacterium]|nr:hypothetical protein [Pirellulaceae bacterium]